MAIVKSNLLNQIYKNYPNFKKKDLESFINIILKEIKISLKNGERVELRNFGVFYTNTQKQSVRRNPKTGEKIEIAEKKTVQWKMSKDIFNKINNE